MISKLNKTLKRAKVISSVHNTSQDPVFSYDNEQQKRLYLNPLWKGCDIGVSATADKYPLEQKTGYSKAF